MDSLNRDIWTVHVPGNKYSEVWDSEMAALFRRKCIEDAGGEAYVYKVKLGTEDYLERTLWADAWRVFKDIASSLGRIGITTGYYVPIKAEEEK